MSDSISDRITKVHQRIIDALCQFGRSHESVKLVAVSKLQPIEAITAAIESGMGCFGENYLQEAKQKIMVLSGRELEWHFIGAIQRNKATEIAQLFDWVHSVDSLSVAKRLNDARTAHLPALNICVQVNVSQETSKSGVSLPELPTLVAAIKSLPRLRIRGLMTVPADCKDFAQQRIPFRQLREAIESLKKSYPDLDTLSMGMSADLEAAIAEGATIVRIGTDIFGPRRG